MTTYIDKHKQWQYASIIATLWALQEMTIGFFFQSMQIPFGGTILTLSSVLILSVFRIVYPHRGVILYAGLITTFFKAFVSRGLIIFPMSAIFVQALIVEVVFLIFPLFFAALLSPFLALMWSFSLKVFNHLIFYGLVVIDIYAKMLKRVGINVTIYQGFLIIIAFAFVLSIPTGILSYKLGKTIRRRLGYD